MKTQFNIAETKFCPYCGQNLVSADSFCPYCGETLPEQPVKSEPKETAHTGFKLQGDADFVRDALESGHFSFGRNVWGTFGMGENSERHMLLQRHLDFLSLLMKRNQSSQDYKMLYRLLKEVLSQPFITNDKITLEFEYQLRICIYLDFLIKCHKSLAENIKSKGNLLSDFELIGSDIVAFQDMCIYKRELMSLEEYGQLCKEALSYNPRSNTPKNIPVENKADSSNKENHEDVEGYADDIKNEIMSLESELRESLPNFKRHTYNFKTDYWKELDDLIGLTSVKEQIRRQINTFKLQMKRKEKHPELKVSSTFHCIFKGNPGTGKTTVARLVAGILKKEGMLKKGCCVEVNSSELITPYIGFSAKNAKLAVLKAMDGVLFIDEAYSLMNSVGGKGDPCAEVIDTLTPMMENYRDRLVVILAGYDEEMDEFLSQSNTGFPSRFKSIIQFEDYNCEEMLKIFFMLVAKDGYKITEDAVRRVALLFNYIDENKYLFYGFANARSVRSMYEKMIERASQRMVENNPGNVDLDTLTVEDVSLTSQDLKAIGLTTDY